MISRYTQNNTAWIDLYQPTHEEIHSIISEYGIPPQLMEDLTSPTRRADVISVQDMIKITLDFPLLKLPQREHPQEIKFIITRNALISARYADIAPLHQFVKEFEVITTLQKVKKTLHAGHLFMAIMNALYTSLGQKLEYIEARLGDIEEEIFNEHETDMVIEISQVGQRLIIFRQTLMAHEQALAKARPHFNELFNHTVGSDISDLEATFQQLMQHLSALGATLVELRETNNTLLSTKQNEIMKTLTIMALVTFPLTLVSSIFGMNTKILPIVGMPGDFWIVIGIMLVTAAFLFIFFRHKRWM